MTLMLLAGAAAGLGLFLFIRELLPAQPALGPALRRAAGPVPSPGDTTAGWRERAGRVLATRLAGTWLDMRIPRKDLALLGRTPESYLVQKATMVLLGLVTPSIVWALLRPPVTWPVSIAAVLGFTIYLFTAPDVAIRSEAATARAQFLAALVAYLDLIGLAAAAGKAPAEALEMPARIGRGWAFDKLASALDPARRGTRSTWDELDRLATEIGVPELADVAAISRRAGTRGASILDTLRARSGSLRDRQYASALARAKARTETMTVPMTLTVFGFLILLGYPAFARMGGA